jgi:uncharacterized membrane protein YdfJ with MMPL/SSD domain
MLDTRVVQAFVLLSVIALLGRWFRWSARKATRRAGITAPVRGQLASRPTILR